MTDKELNKRIFLEYANNFDRSLPEIEGKVQHSLRVADLCEKICKERDAMKEVGYYLGLLHDYYRFEQYTKYKTFRDEKSVDHADLACWLLFQEGHIEKFKIAKSDYALIFFGILNHNKLEINTKQIEDFCQGKVIYLLGKPAKLYYNRNNYDEQTIIKFAKVVRDADKVDIIFRATTEKLKIRCRFSGYTQEVYDDLMQKKSPRKAFAKTKLDGLMIKLGLLFDINFDHTIKFIDVKRYLDTLKKDYATKLKDEDLEFMNKLFEDIIPLLDPQLFQ